MNEKAQRWRRWLATTGGSAAAAAVRLWHTQKHAHVRLGALHAGGGHMHMHGQAGDRGGAPAMREPFYVMLRTGRTPNRTATTGTSPFLKNAADEMLI